MSDRTNWTIVDSRTDQRVTVASFLSEENALSQIEGWKERDKKGIRPDCHESLPYLKPKRK